MTETETQIESYNGWANHSTWNIALWLGNEENLYLAAEKAIDILNRRGKIDTLNCEWAKGFVTVQFELLWGKAETPDGIRVDDPSINWNEIVGVFADIAN